MTSHEKYAHWIMLSDYDFESAAIMLKNERWLHVPVLCQQSAERLLKGMIVYHTNKEAPKSHNIPFLANYLAANEVFAHSEAGVRFLHEKDEYEDFMIDLMVYLTSDYPFSYKKIMERFIDGETAHFIHDNTLKLAMWLKSFQEQDGGAR